MQRVHGAYVADGEIGHVADALRSQGEPRYVEILSPPDTRSAPNRAAPARVVNSKVARQSAEARRQEDIYATAVATVAGDRKVSPGHLHRSLGITEALAAALIGRMEREGLVGPVNLFGRRTINLKPPARSPAAPARVA